MAAEKNFENRIKKFLEENNCWYIKYWGGAAFTKSGIPDLLTCVNGYFVAIEVKAPKGKPSALQLHNINKINEVSQGIAIVLYPDQFDDFKDMVQALHHGRNLDALEIAKTINERVVK